MQFMELEVVQVYLTSQINRVNAPIVLMSLRTGALVKHQHETDNKKF